MYSPLATGAAILTVRLSSEEVLCHLSSRTPRLSATLQVEMLPTLLGRCVEQARHSDEDQGQREALRPPPQ